MKIIMFFKMTVLCDGIMSLRNKRARISSVLLNVRSKILTIYSFIIINIALTSYLSNIILMLWTPQEKCQAHGNVKEKQ